MILRLLSFPPDKWQFLATTCVCSPGKELSDSQDDTAAVQSLLSSQVVSDASAVICGRSWVYRQHLDNFCKV